MEICSDQCGRLVLQKGHEEAVATLKRFEKELKEFDKDIKVHQDKVDVTNKKIIKLVRCPSSECLGHPVHALISFSEIEASVSGGRHREGERGCCSLQENGTSSYGYPPHY